ncbi:MAG: gamma-glutamyltransferase family protein [Lachnospiraceae bacterium]|nr:gamma-glutamyltransferase family protein [Lachnospiraceae bacterium]
MDTRFDPLLQKYPSQRFPIYARNGMVNCSSPQAAALTVVEPTANGIGSDAFALIWSAKDRRLYGLNSSGRAPALASFERILKDGKDVDGKMPVRGWTPVTVPGAPDAWAKANARFGRLSLEEVLEPAIRYAGDGYPCAPNLSESWKASYQFYRQTLTEPCFKAWFDTFAPWGRPYEAGDMIRLPDHAETLRLIGRTKAEAFYRGKLAERIDEESRKYGGYLRKEDLEAHSAEWVEPIRVNYRGYEVCEIPPNGQGIVALMALNILKEFELTGRDDPRTLHLQIEALKLAFADAFFFVTDPHYMKVAYQNLLAPAYGAERAKLITDRAQVFTNGIPPKSGTVYLCAADHEGNMVSWIQSNYMGFGSGIVVGGTGIALQNRGADFSLDPAHANCIAPGKKTYHTIIPGFLMKDGMPVGPFGVMGGYMQPQGHVQVVSNYVDFRLDPQQALDAPRFQWMRDDTVTVEPRFDPNLALSLKRRGHRIRQELSVPSFGRGQMIVRLENGVLVGGTESRTDSNIACF